MDVKAACEKECKALKQKLQKEADPANKQIAEILSKVDEIDEDTISKRLKSLVTKVDIPENVTSIGSYAFYGCKSLQYIRIEATTPPTLSSTTAIPSTIGAIYVPDESVAAYQAATNWSSFASKIKGISEMPA